MMSAGGDDDAECLGQPEVIERERNADEFGDDRQGVEQEEVDDAEGAPELAETLEDEARMADAGYRAETQHHFLVDVEDRDEQRQGPQQSGAVGLAGLAIGRESAGIVVADHNDEAGAENGKQRREPMLPGLARGDVAVKDGSESAVDVTDVRVVKDGGYRLCDIGFDAHGLCPLPLPWRRKSRWPSAGWAYPASQKRPVGKIVGQGFQTGTRQRVRDAAGGASRAVVQGGPPLSGDRHSSEARLGPRCCAGRSW